MKKRTLYTLGWILLLVISISLVCLPRFNRNDFLVSALVGSGPSDADQYMLLAEYFKGNSTGASLQSPFTYRPLVPYIASLLPCETNTAINIINVLFLIFAVLCLYKMLEIFGLPFKANIFGCCLFIFSFPVFYYGTIQYVDPVLISFIMIGTYCIFSGRFAPLLVVVLLGALVKETIIILVPVFFVRQLVTRQSVKKLLLQPAILLLFYGIAIATARSLSIDQDSYNWTISFERIFFNVLRPRSWASAILTLGIPGLGALLLLWKAKKANFREELLLLAPCLAGFFMVVLLFGYSIVSASSDGRFIWPSYAFTIPISLVICNRFKEKGAFATTMKPLGRVVTPLFSG